MMQGLRTEVTTLDKCKLGDLVRELQYPEPEGFSLVTRDAQDEQSSLWLLHLEAWMRAERMDQGTEVLVLRFLDPCRIDVDHLGPVEVKANRLFEAAGALVYSQRGQFLNARMGLHGAGQDLLQLNLSTGFCQRYSEEFKGAYFGRWSLAILPDSATRLDPVTIYEHEVRLE